MREQRLVDIMTIVRKSGYASLQELSDQLGVSLSTVRRDLAKLRSSGVVAMGKNGVIPVAENIVDTPVSFRSNVNANAKAFIAQDALRLVLPGSTVFLDSSTTVLKMADGLRNIQDSVIVTNSLHVVKRLKDCAASVRLIGGEISPASHGFFGPAAEQAVSRYNFDLAFFSPVAVTPQGFAAETIEPAAALRRAAMEQAHSSVLLFDSSKIGLTRPYNIAPLEDFKYLITDDEKHSFAPGPVIRRVQV